MIRASDRTAAEAEALLFDCDGLLVDSEPLWLQTLSEIAEEVGAEIRVDDYTGLASLAASRRLADVFGVGAAELDAEIGRRYRRKLRRGVSPMPGVNGFLLRHHGSAPLAVVSNGRRDEVVPMLESTGLLPFFDLVLTVEDVIRPKPDPEPYLTAAGVLGVEISRCLVFEDSPTGCLAGRSAGATVVGVQAAEVALDAHHRLRSFHEIDRAGPGALAARIPLTTFAPDTRGPRRQESNHDRSDARPQLEPLVRGAHD